MSTSLREVIEAAGYDLSTVEGANWVVAQEDLFDELLAQAEDIIDAEDERLYAIREAEEEAEMKANEEAYQEAFSEEEE